MRSRIAPAALIRYLKTVRGPESSVSQQLIDNALQLRQEISRLRFGPPVAHVYNPLDYAWAAHESYLRRYGCARKRVVFLGMNPGPFGMMQTGVPFGEIAAVREWLRIDSPVQKPDAQHPVRKIDGFDCTRSEVSGRRLWGLFAERFGTAERFFREHLVLNYCPLAFLAESGRNITPAQLPGRKLEALFQTCDRHLVRAVELTQPEWLVGVGGFAAERAHQAACSFSVRVGQILHPSPASPAANNDWTGKVTRQLIEQCVWSDNPN